MSELMHINRYLGISGAMCTPVWEFNSPVQQEYGAMDAGELPRLDGKAKCASQHQHQHQQQVLCIHAPGPTLVVRRVTKMVV
jgi:hypothetical protein